MFNLDILVSNSLYSAFLEDQVRNEQTIALFAIERHIEALKEQRKPVQADMIIQETNKTRREAKRQVGPLPPSNRSTSKYRSPSRPAFNEVIPEPSSRYASILEAGSHRSPVDVPRSRSLASPSESPTQISTESYSPRISHLSNSNTVRLDEGPEHPHAEDPNGLRPLKSLSELPVGSHPEYFFIVPAVQSPSITNDASGVEDISQAPGISKVENTSDVNEMSSSMIDSVNIIKEESPLSQIDSLSRSSEVEECGQSAFEDEDNITVDMSENGQPIFSIQSEPRSQHSTRGVYRLARDRNGKLRAKSVDQEAEITYETCEDKAVSEVGIPKGSLDSVMESKSEVFEALDPYSVRDISQDRPSNKVPVGEIEERREDDEALEVFLVDEGTSGTEHGHAIEEKGKMEEEPIITVALEPSSPGIEIVNPGGDILTEEDTEPQHPAAPYVKPSSTKRRRIKRDDNIFEVRSREAAARRSSGVISTSRRRRRNESGAGPKGEA